jgi:replicative DNA helicase
MSKVVKNFDASLIFNQLSNNDQYFFKVFPHLQEDFFEGVEKVIYKAYEKHYTVYEKPSNSEILNVYIKDASLSEELEKEAFDYVRTNIQSKKDVQYEWILDCTEDFCSQKALYNALVKSVNIYDKGGSDEPISSIPDLIQEALAVSFDDHIGTDYVEDAVERFERLKRKEDKLPFLTGILNKITKGGWERKTINLILASTGVGKSAFLCHYAAEMATQGYNVLYISMEMAEEKIAQRIDANLLDTTMDDLEKLEVIQFADKITRLKKKGLGKIIIKEYPTSSAHMGHVEALLRELKMKKGFVPDIVCLDYLNICLSRRVSLNKGTYLFVKSIAEEFRGLAGKYNFIGASAVQGNRGTIESSDIGMQDTGESKGINDTVDFMMGMMAPEEIAEQGLMLCKQLKSRYDNINVPGKKRFMMTYQREKMIFGEAEDVENFSNYLEPHKVKEKDKKNDEDKPLFDKSTGDRFLEQVKPGANPKNNEFKINF